MPVEMALKRSYPSRDRERLSRELDRPPRDRARAAGRDVAVTGSRDGTRRSAGERARLRDERAESFRCVHCRMEVGTDAMGTGHRNHCPYCLWSKHVDEEPGDRMSDCGGSMEPIAISVRGDGEWVLLHQCKSCGVIHANRTAGDDSALLLVRLAVKPIAQPPFPLDRLGEL
jgi:hypothetical protein